MFVSWTVFYLEILDRPFHAELEALFEISSNMVLIYLTQEKR